MSHKWCFLEWKRYRCEATFALNEPHRRRCEGKSICGITRGHHLLWFSFFWFWIRPHVDASLHCSSQSLSLRAKVVAAPHSKHVLIILRGSLRTKWQIAKSYDRTHATRNEIGSISTKLVDNWSMVLLLVPFERRLPWKWKNENRNNKLSGEQILIWLVHSRGVACCDF